ncbi:hypothetical protein F4781DRAFT_333161 [Annulohypoxylon bovei var. microspora]|nr:hypothetical protein F4781DRAFT_333161 [Annulohypoxylon bovei var. microspora]
MAPSDLTPSTASRPLTTKEISDKAEKFQFNPNIPLKAWLRTANTLNQEGKIYLQDGNFSQAYLLYMRYLTLLITFLPEHPEAKGPEGRRTLNEINKSLPEIITNLEHIKLIIQREGDEWEKSAVKRQQQLREKRQADRIKSKFSSAYEERTAQDPALSSSNRLLDAAEHQELAVELARREIRRRDANRKATRRTSVPLEDEQNRRTAGFWDNWTGELANRQAEDEELFRRQMESTRKELDRTESTQANDISRKESRPPVTTQRHSSYRYPSISKSEPVQYEALQPYRKPTPVPQPPRPPKEGIPWQHEPSPSHVPVPLTSELSAENPIYPERNLLVPTPPPKVYEEPWSPLELNSDPPIPPKVHDDPPAPPKKQQRLTFRPAAYLESGDPIRSIFLPKQLRRQFLSIASENTRRGLEMCGILCGTAVNNALFVRCLLIPEQNCTSDTCETENEGSMFEYCMNEDLLVLGWIHTHPTQTCFMSSRDLHTQAGYQVMLPESIAIVCAPKYEPSYGIFRLTHPPGLDHILNCKQAATFHPHGIDNLYTKAQHPPGHVYENDRLEFYVHDLRPGARNNTVQQKNF